MAVLNSKDNRWDIIDFFNDVNNGKDSIQPMSYDNCMEQRKLYNYPITGCYVDYWNSKGTYAPFDVHHLKLGKVRLSEYGIYLENPESPNGYAVSFVPFTKDLQESVCG